MFQLHTLLLFSTLFVHGYHEGGRGIINEGAIINEGGSIGIGIHSSSIVEAGGGLQEDTRLAIVPEHVRNKYFYH